MSDDAPEDSPLAYRNAHFIDSEGARSLRILAEYLSPLEALRRERIHDTIVFFGSTGSRPTGRSAATTRKPASSRGS